MKITATSDIDLTELQPYWSELESELAVLIEERTVFLRSVNPPTWIQFFADSAWWVKALGAYAAIYVAAIIKEAGGDTWRDRARLVAPAIETENRVLKLARALVRLREQLPARCKLVLGLPVPDDYFGVRFELLGRDQEVLAAEIALFVQYVPAIERLIESEGIEYGEVTGAVTLVIEEDSSLRVAWMDRESLKVAKRIVHLDGTD
jgi:hypothetical protein